MISFQSPSYSSPNVYFSGRTTELFRKKSREWLGRPSTADKVDTWSKSSTRTIASIKSLHSFPSNEAVEKAVEVQIQRHKGLIPEKAAQKLNARVSSNSLREDIENNGGTPNAFQQK